MFQDVNYPWSTCGRVETPFRWSSGVVVGPRHILTASHAITWNADGSAAGPITFSPAQYGSSRPFGWANATLIRLFLRAVSPIDSLEAMFDYVVLVLDWPIGNVTGWMGARGYTDFWDSQPYWSHVGFPSDRGGGLQPTFQTDIALDGLWFQDDAHEAMTHTADVVGGQSGGVPCIYSAEQQDANRSLVTDLIATFVRDGHAHESPFGAVGSLAATACTRDGSPG